MEKEIRTESMMEPIIKEWQESGLSKSRFCENRQMSVHVFKYWCKKLDVRDTVEEQSGKEYVESVETRRGFVRLRHNERYNERYNDLNRVHATLEIHFPQGAVLRMNGRVSSIDLKSLKTLLY